MASLGFNELNQLYCHFKIQWNRFIEAEKISQKMHKLPHIPCMVFTNHLYLTPFWETTSVLRPLSEVVFVESFQYVNLLSCQGCGPTVARAMVVNAAQLASYSQAKQFILGTGRYSRYLGLLLCHFYFIFSGAKPLPESMLIYFLVVSWISRNKL